jgi:hypothetical protein|tara:strand:- start:488 stop:643 length:156 start_codon:yes stop_codon:yes gene_type:complete
VDSINKSIFDEQQTIKKIKNRRSMIASKADEEKDGELDDYSMEEFKQIKVC